MIRARPGLGPHGDWVLRMTIRLGSGSVRHKKDDARGVPQLEPVAVCPPQRLIVTKSNTASRLDTRHASAFLGCPPARNTTRPRVSGRNRARHTYGEILVMNSLSFGAHFAQSGPLAECPSSLLSSKNSASTPATLSFSITRGAIEGGKSLSVVLST